MFENYDFSYDPADEFDREEDFETFAEIEAKQEARDCDYIDALMQGDFL